jgi:hypothetical protein
MSFEKKELRKVRREKIRRLQMKAWRLDPMLWLEERMGESRLSFQWSLIDKKYQDHKWDGSVDPLYRAWMDIASQKWVAVSAATGTSKTYWLSRLVFWFLDTHEDALVVTTAPAESQLKLNLWAEIARAIEKFRRVRPYTRLTAKALKPEGNNFDNPNVPYINSYQAVPFVAGIGAGEESATKAQGFHRKDMLIIVEEAAGINPAMMTAFQNTCTGQNNIMVAVGNPDSEVDQLYQFAQLPNVNDYRISAYDYPNVVVGKEMYAGAVTPVSIQRRRDKYGEDSPLFQSRVRGLTPSEGNDTLIKRLWIRRLHVVGDVPESDMDNSYNAVGVDVANSELGDKASLAYGKQNVLTEVFEFQCPNASHLGYNLLLDSADLLQRDYTDWDVPSIEDYDINSQCVGVDAVGVGVSVINVFENEGMSVVSLQGSPNKDVIPKDDKDEPLYAFRSLRDQMYWELREDIRHERIRFNIDDKEMFEQILFELSIPKFKLKLGKIAIESKDDIKKRMGGKSPNVADAIAYWNWVRKGHYISGGALPIWGG